MAESFRYIFIEKLSVATWIGGVGRELKRELASKDEAQIKVKYIDATKTGLLLANRLLGPLGILPARLSWDLNTLYDERGRSIFLRVQYRDMADLLAQIRSEPEFAASMVGCGEREQLYLVKRSVPGPHVYDESGSWRALMVLQIVRSILAQEIAEGVTGKLLLVRRVWFAAFERFVAKYSDIEVVGVSRPPVFLPAFRRLFGRELLQLGAAWNNRKAPRIDTLCEQSTAQVAQSYYGQFNIDEPELYSDFFYWQQSELPGKRVTMLFESPADPLDSDKLLKMHSHNISALAIDSRATRFSPLTVFWSRDWMLRVGAVLRLLLDRFGTSESRWVRAERDNFRLRRQYWQRIFQRVNAKIHTTWYKYAADHCAISQAMEDVGGISVMYQRSYEGNASAKTALYADVMFGFSEQAAEVERESGSVIPSYFIVGYPGDHRFDAARNRSMSIRDQLADAGCQYTLAFFDENTAEEPRWIFGHEKARADYRFLLERVLAESEFGLLIKPKTPASLRRRLGPVSELLDEALATGRCLLYGGGGMQGSITPVEAACASDIAVHMSVYASTAAVEAALAGVPTVIVDEEGMIDSPLYAIGNGKVIFRDWNTFWEDWTAHRASPGESSRLGQWGSMLGQIDPFCDGHAAERMGSCIQWMLEAYDDGLSRDDVIEKAANRYRSEWGNDRVLSVTA